MLTFKCHLIIMYALSPKSCQADLVKDNGHKYFLSVLADSYMPVRNHSPLTLGHIFLFYLYSGLFLLH